MHIFATFELRARVYTFTGTLNATAITTSVAPGHIPANTLLTFQDTVNTLFVPVGTNIVLVYSVTAQGGAVTTGVVSQNVMAGIELV